MEETKWIGKSLTIWGVVVTAASTLLPTFGASLGLEVTADDVAKVGSSVTDVISAVGTAVGLIMAVIGRMRAKGPATLTGK